mmetsp:Transcript_37322/g.90624  ORF Transcript_37322/g.90624 Transcript_37322/m.90624 type:complete len:138 (-) Transcript_37322:747-1160(-)
MVENNIGIHLVAPPRLRVGGAAHPAKVTSGVHVMRLEHAFPLFPKSSAKPHKCRRSMSLVRDHRHDGKRRVNSALRAPAARRPIQRHCWIGRLVGDRGGNTGVGSLCTRKVVICFPTEERSSSKVGSLKDRTTDQHN